MNSDQVLATMALINSGMKHLASLGVVALLFEAPAFGFSIFTDTFKAKDIAERLGERICALHEAGYSERQAVRTATEQMMEELRNTKIKGTMAKQAMRDTLQATTDRCGITLK